MPRAPNAQDAIDLCQQLFETPVSSITRFETGLCHYVYDIALADGRAIVVRMATDQTRGYIKGGIFWSSVLPPMGIPLPALIYADAFAEPFAYMVLERLAGTDLGDVYPRLAASQKQELARRLSEIQLRVATLPPGSGYGHAVCADGPFPYASWREVLEGNLARSRQWTEAAKLTGIEHIAAVERRLPRYDSYFRSIAPTAFLDDITTKNVLVSEGGLSGIVDVDEVCFGDSLFALALTRMSLLARRLDTDYVDFWIRELGEEAGRYRATGSCCNEPDWIEAGSVTDADRIPCSACGKGVMVMSEHSIH